VVDRVTICKVDLTELAAFVFCSQAVWTAVAFIVVRGVNHQFLRKSSAESHSRLVTSDLFALLVRSERPEITLGLKVNRMKLKGVLELLEDCREVRFMCRLDLEQRVGPFDR